MLRIGWGVRMLGLAAAAASLGVVPSRAAEPTTIASGTVMLPKVGGTNPETIDYTASGCTGSRPDAAFTAFVDVRAHQGRTLRFSSAGQDAGAPSWIILKGISCNATSVGGDSIATTGSIEWTNASPFLGIYFGQPAVNARYTIQAL